MTMKTSDQPRPVPQVMISSTLTDLKEHRIALIGAINKHKLHPNVMEYDDAKLVDVIDSSLQMVRDSAAYICVIGFKYGYIPPSPDRNPDGLSITELEFDEARRRNRPILLFIMSDSHPVTKADIERDPDKERRLDAFREKAKRNLPDSAVARVYAVFNSLEEFKDKIGSSLTELVQHLHIVIQNSKEFLTESTDEQMQIPRPPDLYAEPPYIGSHGFVGRVSQLHELSDWAKPADPTNLLLFEAIGGNGKSMLAWEWTTNPDYALAARPREDAWAGRFWYSFYEQGAVMADFCQRALAYMTGQPLDQLQNKKTTELKEPLLAQLHARPWLLILDGLERVLVAYHRIDAAEIPDEEIDTASDKIVNRNPRDAIRDEDNELIRVLAAAKPSKILVSSRLTPRALLNPSDQPISGVKRINLPGLRPPDAEALLRSCGIEGNSAAIQNYLTANCDNHPLVIGILAGLIKNYLPARGNFDTWILREDGGAQLDLGNLDLIQRRNHILRTAFETLASESRQLLSILAFLSESVDYETLEAFNPHIPPEPTFVKDPDENRRPLTEAEIKDQEHVYGAMSLEQKKKEDAARAKEDKEYQDALRRRRGYLRALADWKVIASSSTARRKLWETVRDLETRGLLQFDHQTSRYDLHPVIRGVVSGFQAAEEKKAHGKRALDHFSSMSHRPYEHAETLRDLRPGLDVVRILLKLGRFKRAAHAFIGDLCIALLFNVEAYSEVLSLLRPFFPKGWQTLPKGLESWVATYLVSAAGIALLESNEARDALGSHQISLSKSLESQDWGNAIQELRNIAGCLVRLNLRAKAIRTDTLALDLATRYGGREDLFLSRLGVFRDQSFIGQWAEAEAMWHVLDPMGREWQRARYRPGTAEYNFALFQFWRGTLQGKHLDTSEQLAVQGRNAVTLRQVRFLRGRWLLERKNWKDAAASLQEALRMEREAGLTEGPSETGLTLVKYHLGQIVEPEREAERLARFRNPAHRYLAQLWLCLGDTAQAKSHALAAYRWAWADGEPYVNRYELTKATELLRNMDVPIPTLQPYDFSKDEPFRWEVDIHNIINKLRAE